MGEEPLTEKLRETLALFTESGEPQTTTEVADQLDLGRRATYGRLERLADRGRLETKTVGANARVWWCSGASQTDEDEPADATHWERQFRSLVDDDSESVTY